MNRLNLARFITAFAVITAVCPMSARAHPHVWIDVHTQLEVDGTGHLSAIREKWFFDEFYSLFALDGLDTDKDGLVSDRELGALAGEMLKNLKEVNYYTVVTKDGKTLPLKASKTASAQYDGKNLTLSFRLGFERNPDLMDGTGLSYAVYDPTYYIEMLNAEEKPVEILVAKEAQGAVVCSYDIRKPDPLGNAVPLSESKFNSPNPPQIGEALAEHVAVKCKRK